MVYSQNWQLADLYPGGVQGDAFKKKLATIEQQIQTLTDEVNNYQAKNDPDFSELVRLTELVQAIESGLQTVGTYINGMISADYTNPLYRPFANQIQGLAAAYNQPLNAYQRLLADFDDATFEQLLKHPALEPVAFTLKELRHSAQRLQSPEQEALLDQLKLDGLNAWASHYDVIAANLNMPFTDENGQTRTISAGQALNMLDGYPDNTARANLMDGYEKMWGDAQDLTADTLNHLAGARLTEQKAHGYKDFLEEPLELNRLSRATLDTMWQVVDDNKHMFKPYFERKAQLLGTDGIGWQDQVAPLTHVGDYQPKTQTFDEAAQFIIENFGKYSPKMAAFAKQAFENQWIEAEDRPGKQPGGWMDTLPDIHESRIFLTFTGSVNDAATIAHELGHAFHSSLLTDLPIWRDDYAMNVAETASTFAELLIADANVQQAQSDAEKVVLLDAKMSNPVSMFLNIRARFLFEKRFYEERQKGYVPAEKLNEIMDAAQKEAFDDILNKRHPHFWSSKLHFFMDDVPFYNFPYTFGYLFSSGIYAWAQKQDNFEDAYISLLRDTANMSTEELAQKHLGVDLTKPDFWQAGADLVKKDIDEFIALSDQFV
ncbi:pepF/M3 family oligoendopeptidase [Weissella uvarum]|uniref:M3 family oligoendopeptidase n=1 Tax=Weissella uvarum TaxID=1479233 RepID=UPI00195FBE25|nr:M3 family oligoendopeptidase [Weissella uvarum]MBM7616802.1 pepF/M3 family oligoendopeptidase [Weissella uvarum]MCM0594744.1 M3 family oligoendopeptidase [Weissella uvarum]